MNDIKQIVGHEIDLVQNANARRALFDSYNDNAESLRVIEGFFDVFSASPWTKEARRIFFRNWRSPGIGCASFCALTFRVLEQAEGATSELKQHLLLRTAARIAEVSREDVGIGTINHQSLYDRFATSLAEDDGWKLDRYQLAGAKVFLNESRRYRENGDDLGVAITRSLPEELYNHGEFAYAAPHFVRWRRDQLGRGQDGLRDDLQFIHDHLGSTESGHFAALVRGLEDYFVAREQEPDWSLLYQSSRDLIDSMAEHYTTLLRRMRDVQSRVEDEAEVAA